MNNRILVLDDEKDLLEAYRKALESASEKPKMQSSRFKAAEETSCFVFELSFATTGEEALSLIANSLSQRKPFAGGFFDVRLGKGIDGIETIRRAKTMDPALFCTIVTAYQDRNIDEIGRIFGDSFADHWDLVNKPFSIHAIKQKAIHTVALWNRVDREQKYLKYMQEREKREDVLRMLLQDSVQKTRGLVAESLSKTTDPRLQENLKQVMGALDASHQALETILKVLAENPDSQILKKVA